MHKNRAYEWYLFAVLGFLSALIGLNVQHDANHGSISRYPFVNRALGLTQNWIGGSHLDWIHQHVVQVCLCQLLFVPAPYLLHLLVFASTTCTPTISTLTPTS